ncbi:MAG: MOSC domain-containing protein [Hydrogenophaga sp.]
MRPLHIQGRRILSAIGKQPVSGPVAVGHMGLDGDEQADPTVHGGPAKAVYAYPVEHLPFWQVQRTAAPPLRGPLPPEGPDSPWGGLAATPRLFDDPLLYGFMGENLSIEGLTEHAVWIGDELHFPGCVLRVTAPREPCFKFAAVMGLPRAGRLMMDALCCGFYLSVVKPGCIEAGQGFRLQPGPRGLSVAQAFAAKRAKHRD